MAGRAKHKGLSILKPLRRFSRDQLTFFALVLMLAGTAFVYRTFASASGEYGSVEQDQYNRILYVRVAYGIGPQTSLYTTECVHKIAADWSLHMAGQGYLSHNPNLGYQLSTQCGVWYNAGENVGMIGISNNDTATASSSLFQAFMNSTEHKNNILSSSYDHMGVGAVVYNNNLWVTQDFPECNYPPSYCGGNWATTAGIPSDPVTTTSSFNPPPACAPSTQTVRLKTYAYLTASSGNGTYSWSAPGSSRPSATGSSFNAYWTTTGTKTVTVTSNSQSASCKVSVVKQ